MSLNLSAILFPGGSAYRRGLSCWNVFLLSLNSLNSVKTFRKDSNASLLLLNLLNSVNSLIVSVKTEKLQWSLIRSWYESYQSQNYFYHCLMLIISLHFFLIHYKDSFSLSFLSYELQFKIAEILGPRSR